VIYRDSKIVGEQVFDSTTVIVVILILATLIAIAGD
jgi:hypothetical protein